MKTKLYLIQLTRNGTKKVTLAGLSLLRCFTVPILLICFVLNDQATAQDLATALTLEQTLNAIADRVDSSIEKAGTVANGVVIRAGSEVWAEIENMRIASKDVLNTAVKDLNSTLTLQLAQIQSDASALEQKTAADTQRVAALAQGIANTLPLNHTQPQVSLVDPSYATFDPDAADATILLTIRGNFFDSALAGLAPFLTVEGKRIDPIEVTTTHMLFNIPTRLFAPVTGNAHSFPLLKLPLTVPYKKSVFLFFSSRKEAQFVLALIGLPTSPGEVKVTTTTSIDVAQRDLVTTSQDNIQSDRDDHDEDRCGPNETHAIDPSSVGLHIDHSEGSTWTQHPVRLNNPSVCYHFRTEHHGIGTSDKVWFHFTYYVTYTLPKVETNVQTFNMKWGDSKVITVPPGQVTIEFVGFDGSHQQYQAANHDNRFIDVSVEGGGFRIAARPLEGILPLN